MLYSGTAAKVLAAMQAHDLKEDGAGKYRANSPFRPGSNSHALTLTIDSDEHGAWFDHVSQESGSLYELARRLGIEVSQGLPVASTKRAYASIDDYAAAHGVSAEVLRAAGWVEVSYQGRPALAFKTATGTRWRFLDGEKPHYISPKGYKASWYGLTASLARKLADGAGLALCNGEISTVAARHYGLAAACITGGEKTIPGDMIQELKSFLGDPAPALTVAFDCDETGRRAGNQVVKQLREAGLPARLVDLGLGRGGDLADFCMLHGSNTSRALTLLPSLPLDSDGSVSFPRNWYIIPAADLQTLPPIEWIVPGEIPARGITVLFGPSGAGKSFLALDYALKIAQSEPVLYMAGEGEYGYRQRVKAWCDHHKQSEGQLYMCIGAVQLMETGDLEAFLAANAAIKPRIVIIDTMARSMVGSDENSTRDMGMFIQACEQVKRALDCAVLIIHHTNKGGVYERGNSALRGASDAMIKITADDDLVIVESAKTKDAQPFQTRYMRLLKVSVSLDGESVESVVMVESDKVIQTPTDPLTMLQEKVLRMLADERFGATRSEISDVTTITYGSLQKILTRLQKLEFVRQDAKGSPYQVTDAGLRRLGMVDPLDPVDPTVSQEQVTTQEDHRDHVDQVDHLGGKHDPIDPTVSDGTQEQPDETSEPVVGNGIIGIIGGDHTDHQTLFDIAPASYYEGGL